MAIQNQRVFFPCQSVGIAPFSTPGSPKTIRGQQVIGFSTRIPITFIKELGHLPTYSSYEELPEIEISFEKVLDGYAPVYCHATQDAVSSDLAGRMNKRCHVYLSVHRDNQSRASGNEISQAFASGAYVQSSGFDFMVNGPSKENVSMVANNLVWSTGSYTYTGHTVANGVTSDSPAFADGVSRRQHIMFASCLLPNDLPGISSNLNAETTVDGNVQFSCSIESIRVSASFSRGAAMELGRKGPFFRFAEVPVPVSTTIDFKDKGLDEIDIAEEGTLGNGDNTEDQAIKLVLEEGLVVNLGTKNRLTSKNRTGGNAGAKGDVMLSYSYSNEDDYDIKHPLDPTVALRP